MWRLSAALAVAVCVAAASPSPSPSPSPASQLDKPHKPEVTDMSADDVTRRDKRDLNDTNNTSKRRVVTGATVLSILGALRDSISAPQSPARAAGMSRVSALVIRPAAPPRAAPRAARPPPPAPRLRQLVVAPHAVAELTCDLDNVTQVTWYKDGEPVSLEAAGQGAAWRWGAAGVRVRAGRGEAGAWRCAGHGDGGQRAGTPIHLALYEAVRGVYLSVDNRRLDANTWVPLRENAPLSIVCVAEGGVPSPELSWRLMGGEAALDPEHYLRIEATNHSSADGVSRSLALLTATRELHNASLLCRATQHDTPEQAGAVEPPEAKLELHVTYAPSFVISRRPGFGVPLRAGRGATLRCDVDSNPPASPWWAREQEEGGAAPAAAGWAEREWARLAPEDGGWYRCRAVWAGQDYSSIGYYLNVQGAEDDNETTAASEQTTEDGAPDGEEPAEQQVDVPLGGSVQLHCPKGSVGCWWRRTASSSRGWSPAGSHHAHGVLGIRDAIYEEGGEYRCVGARAGGELRELKRVSLRVTGGPVARAVWSGPGARGWRLECAACGRRVSARWVLPRGEWRRAELRAAADTDNALPTEETAQCWRAELLLPTAHSQDVLCVVTDGDGGGAVAVFPARAAPSAPRLLSATSAAARGRPALLAVGAWCLQRVRAGWWRPTTQVY